MVIKHTLLHALVCITFALTTSSIALTDDERTIQDTTISVHIPELDEDGAYLFNAGGIKEITLSTLNWAPYIHQGICGQGWVQQVIVSAFARKNYRVRSYFVPWKRAVSMAEMGKVDALYPEYAISHEAKSDILPERYRLELLELSKPFPGGSLAFWKRKETGISFDGDLTKLRKVSIGVVAGYENSPEFDALMDQGYFYISQSVDDWQNVRKLFMKRIALIVGDPLVVEYAIRSNLPSEKVDEYLNNIEVMEPHLAEHALYLAFSRRKNIGKDKIDDFNEAISDMYDSDEIPKIKNYFQAKSHLGMDCEP